MNFQALPKIELHLHLDCSLSYNVVHTINPAISLEAFQRDFIAPPRCTNLVDFLTRASHAVALMQTTEQLRLVTLDLFEQLRSDTHYYVEIRFAPFLHTDKGLDVEQIVATVNEATEQGCQETGIEARLILCTLRHYSTEQSLQTAQLVERFQGTRVAALDIAGDEAGFPITAHIPAFNFAIEHGLARTAHSGEASGPQSVWETLKHFQPARIGHGARSSEDPALLAHLKQEKIHLELCPSSNLQTNMYATYADHPINQLYHDGLSLGINTDSRTITNLSLTQEYERLHTTFGWDKQQFLDCNLNALQASFLPDMLKQQIAEQLRTGYAEA